MARRFVGNLRIVRPARGLLFAMLPMLVGCYAHGTPAIVSIELRDTQTQKPPAGPVWINLNAGAFMVLGGDAKSVEGPGPKFEIVLGPKIYYTVWVDAEGYDLLWFGQFYPQEVSGEWLQLGAERQWPREQPDRNLEVRFTVQSWKGGTPGEGKK